MYSILSGTLSPATGAIPATFLTVRGPDGQVLLVQQTELTNHHADRCLELGKDAPFGFAGPSPEAKQFVLLGRGDDPERLVGQLPRKERSRFDLKAWDPSRPLTIGDHTVFRVTREKSRPGFDRPNQPRIDVDLYDSLWLADVLYPGGRLLTNDEWDLVSGVPQGGILCATRSGKPSLKEAHLYDASRKEQATADVGSYPDFQGFFDLIGDVWERVMPEGIGGSPLRGWSWFNHPGDGRVLAFRDFDHPDGRYFNHPLNRYFSLPDIRFNDVGLRVAVALRTQRT